jgi:tRNA A58 N-methylase Trm61
VRGLGYDLDPVRIEQARRNAIQAGVEGQVDFAEGDLFRVPISRATVVTMFLVPLAIERLTPRLASELAPGTRVVSHTFPIRTWPTVRKLEVEGRTLYLYRVPTRSPLPGR